MERARILAMDTGTANQAFVCLTELETSEGLKLTDFGMIATSKATGTVRERIDIIGNEVLRIAKAYSPTHIAFEDFTEQGKMVGKTYKEMSWLTEHLRMVSKAYGIEPLIWENGAWKKYAMGAQRVNKKQVEHYVTHAMPSVEPILRKRGNSHIWDSVGIGLATYKKIKHERGI